MRRLLASALLAAASWGCGPKPAAGPAAAPPPPAPLPLPNAGELRRDLEVFASDSFRGREAGTPDEAREVRFLAGRLAELGIEPAGDSGFLQRVPLARAQFGAGTRFEVATAERTVSIPAGPALLPWPAFGEGTPLPRVRAAGDLVFLGYPPPGGDSASDPWNALDLRGKAVVVVNGAPPGADAGARAVAESERSIGPVLQRLIPRGPAAVIVLTTGQAARFVGGLANRFRAAPGAASWALGVPDSTRTTPMVLLGVLTDGSPLLPAKWPTSFRPQPLTGRRFSGVVDAATTSYNVVGIVRGSDPALRGSYVAFGAHHDHIGIQPPENPSAGSGQALDSIANGADDDGSGSVMLLALARAFARGPRPARSVLFVWHAGEEAGLLGSEWLTERPPVPMDSIVAQINADMIGRGEPDSLYIVGPAAAPEGQSRVLGAVVDSVNATLARPFVWNREWDSPTHPEQIYFRSDHYNYARRGVPIVFLTTGLHPDYHKVSDEVSKIDFDKLARVGELMYRVGQAVGDRKTRLK